MHLKRTAVYCIFLGTRRHGCNLMLLRGPKLSRNPVHSCFLHLLSRRLALPGPGLRQRRPWLKPSQLSQYPGGTLCGSCFRHPCIPECSRRIPSTTGGVVCSTGEDPLGCESRLLSLRGSVSALSLQSARDTARETLLRASLVQNSNGEHRMRTQWIGSALRPPPFSCRARTPGRAHRCLGGDCQS